jgi:dipeptidyl aminopeptidase/acylaminoacyl peptidase
MPHSASVRLAPRRSAAIPAAPPRQALRFATLVLALTAPIVFAVTSGSLAEGARLQVSDFAKIVAVSDPQFSPDGHSIACVVTRRNMVADRLDREIVLIDVASGAQRSLTFERKALSSPRWSPLGDRIAFLADDGAGKDERAQVWILALAGGDARKLTESPTPVEQFAWRPGGHDIAFVAADEPANKKDIENHLDAFEVGDNDFLQTRAAVPSHLWLAPVDSGAARRLTSGAWSLPKVLPPSSPAAPISWSPDGKLLCFTRQEDPHTGHSDERTVRLLEVDSGEIRKLTEHAKYETYGLFSPDGSKLAYWYPREGDGSNQNEILVTAVSGGAGQNLSRAIDRNILRDLWMPDGKAMLLGGHDGTRTSLWLQPLDGPPRKLALGDVNPAWSFWVDVAVGPHGEIAIAGSTPGRPSELYFMNTPEDSPRRLTSFNDEIASRVLGRSEAIHWKGEGKFADEDGVLICPPDFDKSRKYPLVLVIHGGPRASSGLDFDFHGQVIAARGYVVFEPNYRGSDNLGNAYTHGVWNDAGAGPGRDVMAGLAAVKAMGFVDASKIAVSGWSYGGYMTSWLIGHEHFWKVAVAGAPVTNWFDQYNLGDANVTVGYRLNGSPYKGNNAQNFSAQSPITFAKTINTPTLIMCDTGDFRVPIPQAYELYHAIKDQGVPVKFIAYPVGGHFPADPVRAMDVYGRWTDWIDQHLKESSANDARAATR